MHGESTMKRIEKDNRPPHHRALSRSTWRRSSGSCPGRLRGRKPAIEAQRVSHQRAAKLKNLQSPSVQPGSHASDLLRPPSVTHKQTQTHSLIFIRDLPIPSSCVVASEAVRPHALHQPEDLYRTNFGGAFRSNSSPRLRGGPPRTTPRTPRADPPRCASSCALTLSSHRPSQRRPHSLAPAELWGWPASRPHGVVG